MKTFIVFILLCLVAGCATRQPVNCDWRLKPINGPAPNAKVQAP